jgi:primosomal protein N' (replication factor Y)
VNYIDIILPLPLQRLFTYQINDVEADFLQVGMRVAVPFGKSKIYTGVVFKIHQKAPIAYEAKEIHQILDETPLITEAQLLHWQWIADYYMCSLGEVLRAALPSSFLLQSETKIIRNLKFTDESILDDKEFLIFEALQYQPILTIDKISAIISRKTVLPIIKKLLDKKVIQVQEVLYEKYTPKIVKYIRLAKSWESEEQLQELLDTLGRAPKQREAILLYFQTKAANKKPIPFVAFIKDIHLSAAAVKALVNKEILETYTLQEDRVKMKEATKSLPHLSLLQAATLQEINAVYKEKDICLLHGVTGSGKTEIYTHLIKSYLNKGKQILYLVPEIALTTQLIARLELFFGEQITVFHSRYSMNERVEAWQNILQNKHKAQLIVGARSALFLPFDDLGLIIVDEEHETSYKQLSPAPRYHARDAAIVLAKQMQAKVLLGTATPSIETYRNVKEGKYALITLEERYGNSLLPEIELVDLSETYRKKRMKGHFSERLIKEIQESLQQKEQVILFQNRRGFSPMVTCTSCGISPQCPNCDVSLTYHKYNNELRCHYCGFTAPMPQLCPACQNPTLDTKGFGTEQLELEVQELFPDYKVGRMDFDTTRGKYGYHRIISAFQAQEIDILVGTQMLSKGLDFSNVSLVGVMNADTMLNFPDFRAHERSFQMLVQVSGRAGRKEKRGKVLIQTYNPHHQILQQVTLNDYQTMFKEQLSERWQYKYPPYYRLIKITLSHKDFQRVTEASEWLGQSLRNYFGEWVLGPAAPAIGRIRNKYIKDIIVKIPPEKSIIKTKQQLQQVKNHFQSIAVYRSIRFTVDVDNY